MPVCKAFCFRRPGLLDAIQGSVIGPISNRELSAPPLKELRGDRALWESSYLPSSAAAILRLQPVGKQSQKETNVCDDAGAFG